MEDYKKKIKKILKKLPAEYTIHSICNAEAYAIDLFWDIICRYSVAIEEDNFRGLNTSQNYCRDHEYSKSSYDEVFHSQDMDGSKYDNRGSRQSNYLSIEFYRDMIFIVDQEANHFLSWEQRLRQLGIPLGSLPFSSGLWQSASDTAGNTRFKLLELFYDTACRVPVIALR